MNWSREGRDEAVSRGGTARSAAEGCQSGKHQPEEESFAGGGSGVGRGGAEMCNYIIRSHLLL